MSHYSLGKFGCLDASWNSAGRNSTASRCIAALLNDEFEGSAVAPDAPRGEMPPDHQRRGVGKAREQLAAGRRRLQRIGIGRRRPVEMRHLARVVGDVASEQ